MAFTILSVDDIRRGLEYLPQELYDEIYNFTFTFTDPSGPLDLRDIAKVRADLKLLRVSSATRELYASKCYNRSVIIEVKNPSSYHGARKWLKSLPRKHLALLQTINLIASPSSTVRIERSQLALVNRHRFLTAWIRCCKMAAVEDFGPALTAKLFLEVEGKVYG